MKTSKSFTVHQNSW